MLLDEGGVGDGPQPVLPLRTSGGGSGTGISYYTQVIRCPRKAWLDKELVQLGQHEDIRSGSTAVGTRFHELAELYYGGKTNNPVACPIGDVNYGEAIDEAKRLWRAYIERHPGREFWGEVVGVEYQIPAMTDQPSLEATLVDRTVGVSPFTMRLDLVVKATKQHLFDLPELKVGGVYLVDYKTSSREDGGAALKYANSLQFAAYMMVWDATHEEKCNGMIVINAIATKEPKFRYFLVSPPDEKAKMKVRTMLASAKVLEPTRAALGVSFGCLEYNRICPHLNIRCEGF